VGIFPNILPARDQNYALSIYDSTVSEKNLALALWWWIPGIVLVLGYFAFIHTNAPANSTLVDNLSSCGAPVPSKGDGAPSTIAR
jgi:hypothetical protein